MFDVLEAQKRRPAMKKISTMQAFSNENLKEQKLTVGLDLGYRKVCFIASGVVATFCSRMIFRSLIALETGTHSPWVSRLLTELGHEVIVAHAQKVELITKSNRRRVSTLKLGNPRRY
jgi:hypothetical protein